MIVCEYWRCLILCIVNGVFIVRVMKCYYDDDYGGDDEVFMLFDFIFIYFILVCDVKR